MSSQGKRLRIMAGPNGSGKSTILQEVRKRFYSGPFVNADEIEKTLREKSVLNLPALYDLTIQEATFLSYLKGTGKSWITKAESEQFPINLRYSEGMLVTEKEPSSYDAAMAADFIRFQLLNKGETFTFETVMSHSSKIDFLRESKETSFKNYLYFICTADPQINISRVHQRVELGGHPVPDSRIIKRYHESLQVLPEIIPLCHRVFLFDNSTEERSIEPVAEIDSVKRFIARTEYIPWWVEEFVINKFYK